ncbi:MAG: hypothetical protein ACRDCT_14375 [Shewanella sp.]
MLINRSKLTSSAPARGWRGRNTPVYLTPLFYFESCRLFITEGWQKWHLVNQLEVRGDVAIGRVIDTEYQSEQGSNDISRQRLVCLVE